MRATSPHLTSPHLTSPSPPLPSPSPPLTLASPPLTLTSPHPPLTLIAYAQATHLIKTEPMQREDKELQAEARGRRLGASGRLTILQMLMAGTIEEAAYESLEETRKQLEGSEARGESSKKVGKRPRTVEADDGTQLAMLSALKLLRPPDDEDEDQAGESDV